VTPVQKHMMRMSRFHQRLILRSFICRPAKRLQRSDAGMDADALKEKVDDAPPAHQQAAAAATTATTTVCWSESCPRTISRNLPTAATQARQSTRTKRGHDDQRRRRRRQSVCYSQHQGRDQINDALLLHVDARHAIFLLARRKMIAATIHHAKITN
jgi:hypothetical protein